MKFYYRKCPNINLNVWFMRYVFFNLSSYNQNTKNGRLTSK